MPAQRKFFGFLFLFLGLIFWVARSATPCYGANLLQNPGFEDGVSSWNKWGSGTLEITSESRSGSQAGQFSTSGTTTATFIHQAIPVTAGQSYQFSGFAKIADGNGDVYLKVSFYSSSDGSGSKLSDVQSSKATNPTDYTSLMIDIFEVPPEANSVKVKAYLDPLDEGETVAYFDDFSLEETALPTNTPIPTATPEPTSTPTNTPTPTPTSTYVSYPSGVYISEFMANPSEGNEWVELYNSNDHSVTLSDWKIRDETDSNYNQFSTDMDGKSYKAIDLSSSLGLNNDGDTVKLVRPDGVTVDEKSYGSTTKGKSWSKDSNGNWCQIDPTKNQSNPSCPGQETPAPTSTPTPTPTPTPRLTLTSTPTPTKIPTSTPTPSGEILGATEAGEATFSLHLEDEKVEDKKSPPSPHLWPKVLIGLGLVLIVGACYPLWLPKVKMLYNSYRGKS